MTLSVTHCAVDPRLDRYDIHVNDVSIIDCPLVFYEAAVSVQTLAEGEELVETDETWTPWMAGREALEEMVAWAASEKRQLVILTRSRHERDSLRATAIFTWPAAWIQIGGSTKRRVPRDAVLPEGLPMDAKQVRAWLRKNIPAGMAVLLVHPLEEDPGSMDMLTVYGGGISEELMLSGGYERTDTDVRAAASVYNAKALMMQLYVGEPLANVTSDGVKLS